MAHTIEVPTPTGETNVFVCIGGFSFPKIAMEHMWAAKEIDLQLKWIKETEIRDDDVLIAAFPKTGTHWTWEIINMIQQGTSEYQKETKEAAMLEHCTPEMTSSMASPRVLNTHFTYDYIPDGIKEKKSKIVHVMRNPKDVAVSMFHHGQMIPHAPKLPFEIFCKSFRGAFGLSPHCSYMWYIKEWEQIRKDNPDQPILNIFYEDLKKKPEVEIKKIAKFLEKDIDDKLVAEISDKCNFNKLKKAHEDKNDIMKEKLPGGTQGLYRKGITGDWKNYFTVTESEEYDKWVSAELGETGIKFNYE